MVNRRATPTLLSDTAIILLTGGYSQLTTFYGYGLFDGIEVGGLSTSVGQAIGEGNALLIYPSPCTDQLHVNRGGPYVINDAAGRVVA